MSTNGMDLIGIALETFKVQVVLKVRRVLLVLTVQMEPMVLREIKEK